MELPPINLEDFTKWKTGMAIVKVIYLNCLISLQETDMDDMIKGEAKDFVISGIEKASGQFGINIEVRKQFHYSKASKYSI